MVLNKVLHIMSSYGGGISSFVENKAKALINTSVTFDVITFDDTPTKFDDLISEMGGEVYRISNPKKHGYRTFYNQVNKIFSKQPKDVLIHSHVNGVKALPFYLIAKKNRLNRFAIHAHTAAPLTKSATNLRFRQKINRSIANEKLSCGIKATENIFGIKSAYKDKIMHIPNSIDEDKLIHSRDNPFEKSNLKKEILGITDNRIVIGNIARFRYLKNHIFMIDIIEELQNNNVEFIWFFAGDGLLRKDIEIEVKSRGLSDSVAFLGYRDDIVSLFKIMDIFTLPSLHEGLPTVLIEAQASSTYSLVSDTITDEADLELGLVKYLDITDESSWVYSINNFKQKNVSSDLIKKRIIDNKFTNEESANLYYDFLTNKIDNYYI